MRKIHGIICIAIGTALLITALSLVLYNWNQNKKSGEAAQKVLTQLKDEIPMQPEKSTEMTTTFPGYDIFMEYETEPTSPPVKEEATLVVDDYGYIGIIAIPSLDLELPVMSEWSYEGLKISPCRYKGSAAGGDMIIAAHNYSTHFGRIKGLNSGDEIIFTDADGYVHRYEINQISEINGKDIEGMDFGSADSWDLTLFTCTLSGQSRVTVRAEEITEEE